VSLLGLEPKTYGLKVCGAPPDSTGKTALSAEVAAPDAAPGAEVDSELAIVIEAWPDLPDVIRRGILALATVSPPAVFTTQVRDQ